MSERLYQPDFSGIFGKAYANAFLYGKIDSLIWPILTDFQHSPKLLNLLSMQNEDGHPYFYRRGISLDHLKVEMKCSNIDVGILQAMDLGREYGISNQDVAKIVKKEPQMFKAVFSYDFSNENNVKKAISDIDSKYKEIDIAGVVIYPSYTKFDLSGTDSRNKEFDKFLEYCNDNNLFLKIDIGNLFLPQNYSEYTTHHKLKSFLSQHPKTIFILSGLDVSGDFTLYYQLLKYFNNLWIEIDPRSFGGSTPTYYIKQLFKLKGFIQNTWHRLCIGSATPTLESSQMMRGFLEATDNLPFSQKNILRTWSFRNLNRLNPLSFPPMKPQDPEIYDTLVESKLTDTFKKENYITLTFKLTMRSYSITQLLFLTDIIKKTFQKSVEEYPDYNNGKILLKSYHTTTTLIVNEHEIGNYLDLHYMFAEKSKQPADSYLHTVRALENRADFNHYDHELASTYGNRQLIIPITNQKLEIGGRENYYILVTFGPRTFNILLQIELHK